MDQANLVLVKRKGNQMTKKLEELTPDELEVLWRKINGLNNYANLDGLQLALDDVYEAYAKKMGWEG